MKILTVDRIHTKRSNERLLVMINRCGYTYESSSSSWRFSNELHCVVAVVCNVSSKLSSNSSDWSISVSFLSISLCSRTFEELKGDDDIVCLVFGGLASTRDGDEIDKPDCNPLSRLEWVLIVGAIVRSQVEISGAGYDGTGGIGGGEFGTGGKGKISELTGVSSELKIYKTKQIIINVT